MFINNNYRLNEKALHNKKTNNSFNAQEKKHTTTSLFKAKTHVPSSILFSSAIGGLVYAAVDGFILNNGKNVAKEVKNEEKSNSVKLHPFMEKLQDDVSKIRKDKPWAYVLMACGLVVGVASLLQITKNNIWVTKKENETKEEALERKLKQSEQYLPAVSVLSGLAISLPCIKPLNEEVIKQYKQHDAIKRVGLVSLLGIATAALTYIGTKTINKFTLDKFKKEQKQEV